MVLLVGDDDMMSYIVLHCSESEVSFNAADHTVSAVVVFIFQKQTTSGRHTCGADPSHQH